MKPDFEKTSDYHRYGKGLNKLIEKISWNARIQMFKLIISELKPLATDKVLDVGVTSDQRADCNFFEKLYPWSNQITAVGTQEASFLEHRFPGLTFINADGCQLPFGDNSFDLVVSFATIEHVGNEQAQRDFVRELFRVGKRVCISTPNRWFPLEFHTVLPLVHWLPKNIFRRICRLLGKTFFSDEKNLTILSSRDLRTLAPLASSMKILKFRLAGLTSNLLLFIYKQSIIK